jgi:Fur family ferric uptake transcriptional regulator
MMATSPLNQPIVVAPRPQAVAKTSTPVELATAKLKSAGLRITQPRMAILTALSNRSQPTSIEQLHADVGPDNCDLVTVYRCVSAFQDIGVVRRAFFHDGTAMYELNVGRAARYHVVCKRTNRVDELDKETSEELRRALEGVQEKLRARGYEDLTHMVEFFGVAPEPVSAASPVVQTSAVA